MPPPSQARQFFDDIVASPDPVGAVRRLIDSDPPTAETDWLDFKTEHPTDPKQRDKKNRELWSEHLGGFANNQGGVLVWGVDARKKVVGGREIDAACGEVPVADPAGLAAKLVEWQRQATDPPLANVEVRALPLADTPDRGFVVCYVPEGAFKPYRSEQTPEKQYYLRAGANTVVMSRSVLGSLFHPRSRAAFQFRATLTWEPPATGQFMSGGDPGKLACEVGVFNRGTATARDLFVLVSAAGLGGPSKFTPLAGSHRTVQGGDFDVQVDAPIHPHRSTMLFSAEWRIERRGVANYEFTRWPTPVLQFACYCEDQAPQTARLAFGLEELLLQRRMIVEATADGESLS